MKRNRGFSLVELMVVVGIMGILASIAIPRFQTYQAKAKRTEAQSLLGQIFTLMTVNYNDYGTYQTNGTGDDISAKKGFANRVGREASTTSDCTFAGSWPGFIGFAISPCSTTLVKQMPFYTYWLQTVNDKDFSAYAQDSAQVVNNCPGATAPNLYLDELSINNEKKIAIRVDGVNCVYGKDDAGAAVTGNVTST